MATDELDELGKERAGAYATVAVDEPVDAEYTYRVPGDMVKEVVVGSRVVVPLGRGNRMVGGTVLGLSGEAPEFVKQAEAKQAAESGEEEAGMLFDEGGPPVVEMAGGVKNVHDVLRNVPPVPEDLLRLARWISTYYCCPMGMTLATMVPSAVKRAVRAPTNAMVSLAEVGKSAEELVAGKLVGGKKVSARAVKALEQIVEVLQGGEKTELELLAAARVKHTMVRKFVEMGVLVPRKQLQMPVLTGADAVKEAGLLTLSGEQARAMTEIERLIDAGEFGVRMIFGVTGSGKTELYIRAIEKVVRAGKRAIVLVPEISLTPQTVARFMKRFERVAVLHSGLKDSERHQHWRAIAEGWAQVIVGARSAIFAPAKDIGLIVVDEEHDHSYKQDSAPKYHGRDVAIRRGHMLGVPVLLGSATPSLESWQNANGGNAKYGLLTLKNRPLGTQMPRVVVVDMKEQSHERRGLHILSTTLEHHLKATLEAKKQALFLLNRRGYAHYVMCPRCMWVMMCENCDSTMVVHRSMEEGEVKNAGGGSEGERAARFAARYGMVKCHYCMAAMILPGKCPSCQARLTHLGQGTQRAEDELLRKFPTLRIARMDSDTMNKAADYQEVLEAFGQGELDLLIGTQMIAKGLDFPNVQLVGVLNSDLAMTMPDFRAAERTFQLICQVAGRSGRSADRGTVVVQTFQPQEPAILHACNHDYLGFAAGELPHRKEFGYPPFGRLVRVVMAHKGHTRVNQAGMAFRKLVDEVIAQLKLAVKVQGPLPPPMERIQEEYRVEMLMMAESAASLQHLLGALRRRGALKGGGKGGGVSVSVDVDPMSML